MEETSVTKLWHFPNPNEKGFADAIAQVAIAATVINNPWAPTDIDKMELKGSTSPNEKAFREMVDACRFFYEHDPIVSTTINKLIELGINELHFDSEGLSPNEMRIFEALENDLKEFSENLALEYLISGLVVPEIRYGAVGASDIKRKGIKKYTSLTLPVSMWVRDPSTVIINTTTFGDRVSYFVEIPEKLIQFVKNEGVYPDGSKDPLLWSELLTYYGDFVIKIQKGERYFLLDNRNIFRRRVLSNKSYPTPYLSSALESLKHKRNLRRMDYSIAARAISAIQLVKLGDKDFPITEDDQDQFDSIRNQMMWRNSPNRDIEMIFQLFANHTLQIEWVYPPMEALLDDKKYMEVNQDIIFAMGFPRILITGETERSSGGNQEFAMLSPKATIDNFREKILQVLEDIVFEVADKNNLKSVPEIRFEPITLYDYQTLLKSLADLYTNGNISRTSYAERLGYNFEDEAKQRAEENKLIEELQLEPTAPSNVPGANNQDNNSQPSKKSNIKNTSNNQKE